MKKRFTASGLRCRVSRVLNRQRQAGNALLFSLLIMGSALTASLGMATLVTGEISNVALIPPSERAYYKAESFVEQGLWEKKQEPSYDVTSTADLSPTFLCTGNCFQTNPRNQAGSLISYQATTSIPAGKITLHQDQATQLDIDTTDATAATGRFSLGSIKPENGLLGVEVTVFSFPQNAPFSRIGNASQDTPVLVETKLFRPSDASLTMNIGQGQTNRLGEQFPRLDTSVYRLRIKALGADTEIEPTATYGVSTKLELLAPDFRVQAVAADGSARRGIEALVPATEQIANVFDFVIFSDLALSKTDAKVEVNKSLRVNAYNDVDEDCTRDATDTPRANLPIQVSPGYTATTDTGGVASFSDVQPGTYSVSATLGANLQACTPYPKTVTFADNQSNEAQQVELLIKTPVPRVPLHRFYSGAYNDHAYTAVPCAQNLFTRCSGGSYIPGAFYNVDNFNIPGLYQYEGVAGYLYSSQVTGTQPLYRAWHPGVGDHFYTMSAQEGSAAYLGQFGYVTQGITGYLYPHAGSCSAGSSPLYRINNVAGTNHFYTMSVAERNTVLAAGWANEGITGCMWTTANGGTDESD